MVDKPNRYAILTPYLNRTGFFIMSFSNQIITPVHKHKPHIVKMQGLWRVSPYAWKKLWHLEIAGRWTYAHVLTNKLNSVIHAEQEAAKERQREFKRKHKEVSK